MSNSHLIRCHDCDRLQSYTLAEEGYQVRCNRCDALLDRNPEDSVNRTLAFALTGLVLFFIANLYPFLSLELQGQNQSTILFTGIMELYNQGLVWLAVLVFFTIVLVPSVELGGLVYILVPIKLSLPPLPGTKIVARIVHKLHHWSMMDIFMLGILVSMVKVTAMAEVIVGPAFYAFMILIFVVSATKRAFDPSIIWSVLTPESNRGNKKEVFNDTAVVISCHSCHQLCELPSDENSYSMICPRCGSALHRRKPNSISKTWALTLAAAILYIPANLLPVSVITSLAGKQEDTLISSVIYFFNTGSIPIALVIFTASILVPILKLIILTLLLISVQTGYSRQRRERTKLFRITEALGRWSMVDVFVVTVLVAMVKLGVIATIEAGPGIVFFAAVVIITMIAATTFDPRLIWDHSKSQRIQKTTSVKLEST
ncbi:MAG: paraquat-inducible protein A [Proteobacteria bacterium]|nr:paraquat-inducible protein A [Pseudomonadota bacterium]